MNISYLRKSQILSFNTSYIANWNLKTRLASFRFFLVISARVKTTPSPHDICFLQISKQGTKKTSADSTNRNNDCLLTTHSPNITNMLSTTNWVSEREANLVFKFQFAIYDVVSWKRQSLMLITLYLDLQLEIDRLSRYFNTKRLFLWRRYSTVLTTYIWNYRHHVRYKVNDKRSRYFKTISVTYWTGASNTLSPNKCKLIEVELEWLIALWCRPQNIRSDDLSSSFGLHAGAYHQKKTKRS
jgi:hypothetical protein